jgi:tetratricopeptide (TPR) repeat protein
MALTMRCPQGHVWENASDATLEPGSALSCPVCGSATDDPAPDTAHTLNTFDSPTDPPRPPPPGTLPPRAPSRPAVTLPGYEILGELGRGGMGVVLKARHLALKRLVALKMILGSGLAGPEQLLRFRKEAEAVARLQHPNIVQVFDVGEHDGYPYLSLEFVDGGTLAGKLKGCPLPPRAAAGMLETLARAVHYAHERGIIHRDLKPANILLATDGTPKITDFGLAKQMDQGPEQSTRAGVIAGTPAYMAPEQATGRTDQFGPRTDVWALGIILYELTTGKLPFDGNDAMEVLRRVTSEEAASPRTYQAALPRDLEVITLKCLSKVPERRYTSAGELADDLRRFLQHEPIRARPTSAGERLVRWVWRHPAVTALAAGLLLAATAWGMVAVTHYRDAEAKRAEIVADANYALERARAAVSQSDWDRAAELMAELTTAAAAPEVNAAVRDETERLNRQVQVRLAARETQRRFTALRDDALFQAAPGVTTAVRETANQALDLVGYRNADDWLPSDEFSDAQAVEILCGVFELQVLTAPDGKLAGVSAAARRAADEYQRRRGASDSARRAFAGLELYLAGLDHFEHGRHAAALDAFTAALLAQPERYWARYFQALSYARLGQRPELVRDALTVCLARRTDVVWPYLQRGFAHAQLAAYDAADADFREAERLLGNRPDPQAEYVLLNNRAVARLGQGKVDDALTDLGRAARLKPDAYQAFLTSAQAFRIKHDPTAALRSLDDALARAERPGKESQVPPATLALVYRTRAHWRLEQKDTESALRDLATASSLEPAAASRARLLRDRGQLFARQHRFAEAVASFDDALRQTPGDADVLLVRAECLLNLEKWDEAEAGYSQAFAASIRPTAKALAYRATARLRRAKRDALGAFLDLTLALDLEPANVSWRAQRSQAAMANEDYATAVSDCDAVLAKEPSRVGDRLLRAQAELKLGRTDDAVRDADAVLHTANRKAAQTYSAATIFARAAGLLDRPSEASRQAARQRWQYQNRALEALSQLFASLPPEERASFWRDYPARDAALAPVRASDDYRRLERVFANSSESH